MILNCYLLLAQHDQQLVKTIAKTLQTSHCGCLSFIKMHHSQKLLNFVILKLKAIHCNHQISHCHFHIKRTKL